MRELPEGYKDGIYSDTTIKFSFKDKLKILFGYKVEIRTLTWCENVAGKTMNGESRVLVYRDRPLPKGWGAVEAKHEARN